MPTTYLLGGLDCLAFLTFQIIELYKEARHLIMCIDVIKLNKIKHNKTSSKLTSLE